MTDGIDEIDALATTYRALSGVPHEAHPRMLEWLRARLEWDEQQRQETETREDSTP